MVSDYCSASLSLSVPLTPRLLAIGTTMQVGGCVKAENRGFTYDSPSSAHPSLDSSFLYSLACFAELGWWLVPLVLVGLHFPPYLV